MLLALLLACSDPPRDEPAPAAGGDDTSDSGPDRVASLSELDAIGVRNVVFVHVDTLRADHLPAYGYARDTTPSLAGRAALVVDGYRPAAPWTLPATASVLTGLDGARHGITHVLPDGTTLVLDAPTFAESLQAAGWRTFVSSGNDAINDGTTGYFDGFEEVNPLVAGYLPHRMESNAGAALAWLDTLPAEASSFVWLQPMDAHGPYDPGDAFLGTWSNPDALPFDLDSNAEEQITQVQEALARATTDEERAAIRQALVDVYDEGILTFDTGLRELFDGLAVRGRLDDTLVVIAADHGETLLDDPTVVSVGHGGTVREELVAGALVFVHPRLASGRVRCLSTSQDLAPTFLRLLGAPGLEGIDGIPIQEECRQIMVSSTFHTAIAERRPLEVGASDGRYTVRRRCEVGIEERYDLAADPAGVRPIAAEDVPEYTRYADALDGYLALLADQLGSEGCPTER